jgi:cholesterol oxidase
MGKEFDALPAAVSFNEEVGGYLVFEETSREAAARVGDATQARIALQLRVTADDADRFLADERHAARVTGWVRMDMLGGALEVEEGTFNVVAGAGGRRMEYRLQLHDGADRGLTLVGSKEQEADGTFSLHLRLLAGHVDAGEDAAVMATGTLRLLADDVAKQLMTLHVSPPLRLDALARFSALFARDPWATQR